MSIAAREMLKTASDTGISFGSAARVSAVSDSNSGMNKMACIGLGELDRLRHPLSHPAEPGVDAHLEPAVDGRRDVIGVALRVRGELKEKLLGLGRGEILAGERQTGGEPGDERRRGGTEAARGECD